MLECLSYALDLDHMGNLYFRAWRRYLAGPCFVVQAAKAFWQSAETSEHRDKVNEAVFGGERGTIGGKRGRADKVCFDPERHRGGCRTPFHQHQTCALLEEGF